jgi:copper(I)-binding protein
MLRPLPLLLCAWLAACSAEQPPLLAEAVVLTRPLPGTHMGAGYMTLRNTSDQPIRIDKVASPDLVAVSMHESVVEDGIARMLALPELLIPPHESVVFAPGGKHLMIHYPAATTDFVTLQFYADAAMLLAIQVHPEE